MPYLVAPFGGARLLGTGDLAGGAAYVVCSCPFVLLLFSPVGMVTTGVCEAGKGALSSLNKLVDKLRCCTCVRRNRCGRVWAMIPYSLCLALCLLLVVAGDVETNPGPISGEGKHCSVVLWSEILVTKRPPN